MYKEISDRVELSVNPIVKLPIYLNKRLFIRTYGSMLQKVRCFMIDLLYMLCI